ncbi:MAG TPA: asparagine synthase C-terminal domain-containing protein [Terriglobia bacterium]|nr:asparagine synthase C-terminal domain-containing protein [Terriglobia bacterium]
MRKFRLKIDLASGTPLDETGFEADVRSEGSSRLALRSKFVRGNYRFYVAGRCYSWSSSDQLEAWMCRFSPDSISAWAREIDGDLVILVLDARRRQVHLISDRNGAFRTYYRCEKGCVVASNSLVEIIRMVDSPRLSSFAAYQSLTMLHGLDPHSPIEGIQTTMPGQIVSLSSSGAGAGSYYSPVRLDSEYLDSERECVAALDAAYQRVFRKRLTRERTPCVLLSGGIDSLTMLKYAKEAALGPILTLTFSFKNLHPNELEPARIAARHFGTDHREIVIEPERALDLYLRALAAGESSNPASLVALAEKDYLEQTGQAMAVFTGEDSRLHTPSFDAAREIGIVLNQNPSGTRRRRAVAAVIAKLLRRYPFRGSLNNYLSHWANQLTPRPDFKRFLIEALTAFHLPAGAETAIDGNFSRLLMALPRFDAEDDLQAIYKKYVAFEYRSHWTHDMNCGVSNWAGPLTELHFPFYDWEAIEAFNRVPYRLARRGNFTLRSGSKMPFVRKRMARAVVEHSVPKELLFRAKKTCPALHLLFNSSLGDFVSLLLKKWAPSLAQSVDPDVRVIIEATIATFSQRRRFYLNQDEYLLSTILVICHLATLNQLCANQSLGIEAELRALREQAIMESSGVKAA